MKICNVCRDEFDDEDVGPSGDCCWCTQKKAFSQFARDAGLTRFLDPTGERYVYLLDGSCAGKKSECIDFMEELWNALVRAKGGTENLMLEQS